MGRASRDKGARYEREVVRAVQAHGLVCYRVAGSGALASRVQSSRAALMLRDDVVIELAGGAEVRVECKTRESLSAYLAPGVRLGSGAVRILSESAALAEIRGDTHSTVYTESTRAMPRYLTDWLSSTGVVCMRQDRGPRLWVLRDDWPEINGLGLARNLEGRHEG